MAIVKISDLPLVDQPVEGTDLFVVVQDNVTKKAYASDIQTYVGFEEFQTATAGQTVFNLTTMTYAAGANNLQVFVDGVNQYVGSSYLETDNNTVTFTQGLHEGALVKFSTVQTLSTVDTSSANILFTQGGTGAVTRSVQSRLRETVSVKDFGAVGNGIADDTVAIQNAVNYASSIGGSTVLLQGTFKVSNSINVPNYVRLMGGGRTVTRIEAAANNFSIFKVYRPPGSVPALAQSIGFYNMTIVGTGAGNGCTGIELTNAQGVIIEQVEIAICTDGIFLNKSAGESYFHEVRSCQFASCFNAITFGGAANRNTFTTNTYTNCQVAFDFSRYGNVSETNVFINENVEGCYNTFEWGAVVYGQTWIGLTVENPASNGYVCTVKDPGRQLFVNLGLIPAPNPAAVDFYKINANYSTLIGSKNSSAGYSYGLRFAEEAALYVGLVNYAKWGNTGYTGTISAGASAAVTITVTGAAVGDLVKVSANKDLLGCVLSGWVSSADTVTVRIQNATTGSVSLSSVNITAAVERVATP